MLDNLVLCFQKTPVWIEAAERAKPMLAKKPGRPGRPVEPGERLQIGVQVSPRVKRLLETAAEQNHRSLSREAEFRLEQSFQRDRIFEEIGRMQAALNTIDERIDSGERSAQRIEDTTAKLDALMTDLEERLARVRSAKRAGAK